MPRDKNAHNLGPARDEVMRRLRSDTVQQFIIDSGERGVLRNEIIAHLWAGGIGGPIDGGPIRYSEWGLARLWFRTLGYRSLRENGWRWVHPHYFMPAIPLAPMKNGVTFSDGKSLKSNLSPREKARGTGAPFSWDDRDILHEQSMEEARSAKRDYDDEVIVVAEHTRSGGTTVVKEHTRRRRKKEFVETTEDPAGSFEPGDPIMQDDPSARPSWVEAAEEVEGIEIIETNTKEIIFKITVPTGVDVKVNLDEQMTPPASPAERPTPPVGFEDFFTKPSLPHNIEKKAREQLSAKQKIREGALTANQRAEFARQRALLIGQVITQPGPFQGQVVLDHVVGSQYVVAFSVHGDGEGFVYHKKQTLDGSDIEAEMSGGWREWVVVDE